MQLASISKLLTCSDPALIARSRPAMIAWALSAFVFLDTSASSEGWHVQWERVPPGKKLAPRSLSHVRGGNETDEAD